MRTFPFSISLTYFSVDGFVTIASLEKTQFQPNLNEAKIKKEGEEKERWLEEANTMHDWVVWCRSKKGAEEISSFELSGKEIFFNYDETKLKEEKNKKNGSKMTAHPRRVERTIQVMAEARQHQNGSE